MLHSNQKLMAAWSYDQPPYYIMAEIIDIRNDGCIQAKGFDGMWFKPVIILPLDQDRIDELKAIETMYRQKSKELTQQVRQDAKRVVFLEPF